MRENDIAPDLVDPHTADKIRNRHIRTWGGLIVSCAAIVFAFMHPEKFWWSFTFGLIGSGMVDPSLVYQSLKPSDK